MKKILALTIILSLGSQVLGMQYIPGFKKKDPKPTKCQQVGCIAKKVATNRRVQVALGALALGGTIGAFGVLGLYVYTKFAGLEEKQEEIKKKLARMFHEPQKNFIK